MPTQTLEIAVVSYVLIFAACFNAWLFSEMSVLIDGFSQKFLADERQITGLFEFSWYFMLIKRDSDDLFEFTRKNHHSRRKYEQLLIFMDEINDYLRCKISTQFFIPLLE